MAQALQLARRGLGQTWPNPSVGAIVVAPGGEVLARGWTAPGGRPHAEAIALERAGGSARGATLYVTLEPCAHVGRTPPCADAVIAAGIGRCVVALRDPHSIVDGRGLRALRRAGIEVEVGLMAEAARAQLRGYVLALTRGRPRVTWKIATTLDGRIADSTGRSRWITGEESRRRGHRMRALADAILIGAGTARADDPRLTARDAGPRLRPRGSMAGVRQPLRVVCDTGLTLPLSLGLFGRALARGTVVACGRRAPARRQAVLEARGVTVWRLPSARAGVRPLALARRLVRAGCHDVLLEGGARFGTAWVHAGLVDRIALFVAPDLLGGDGLSWLGTLGVRTLARARRGRIVQHAIEGRDAFLLVDLDPKAAHGLKRNGG